MTAPTARLRAALSGIEAGPIGVAVSGGSDSVALLLLASDWARAEGRDLQVVTVDHGLRDAARAEAETVAQLAASLGLSHQILLWQGWDGSGNLQDAARQARYRLMAEWAQGQGLVRVLLGHTAEDQAETLLMRLGRGAGVDGLAAMSAQKSSHGVTFLRPLLQVSREALRQELRQRGIDWIEDPSNTDSKFHRVRLRQAAGPLAELGLTRMALCQVAENAAQAQAALNWACADFARQHVMQVAGDLWIDARGFATLPEELARRLMRHALAWISGEGYPPRGEALTRFVAAGREGQTATLLGCRMVQRKGGLHLHREYQAVCETRAEQAGVFDGRWHIEGPWQHGYHVAPLGQTGLRHCPEWRNSGRPAAAHAADPAIWQEKQLIAAPLAGKLHGWRIALRDGREDFIKAVITR